MQLKSKLEYATEAERDAWQRGYNCFEPHKGPPGTGQDVLDAITPPGARSVVLHPLAVELLGELFGEFPEHLHGPLADGFGCAMYDSIQKRQAKD